LPEVILSPEDIERLKGAGMLKPETAEKAKKAHQSAVAGVRSFDAQRGLKRGSGLESRGVFAPLIETGAAAAGGMSQGQGEPTDQIMSPEQRQARRQRIRQRRMERDMGAIDTMLRENTYQMPLGSRQPDGALVGEHFRPDVSEAFQLPVGQYYWDVEKPLQKLNKRQRDLFQKLLVQEGQ